MYKVLVDGKTLYSPGSKEYGLTSAKLDLQAGAAGKFDFTVPPTNPMAEKIHLRTSLVSVLQDDEEIFYGFVSEMSGYDMQKCRTFTALSALSWLGDSVQSQHEYYNSRVREYVESLIKVHNASTETVKHFEVGMVSIDDSGTTDDMYRYTDYESTLSALRRQLVEPLGGFLKVRHEGGKLILDYLPIDEYGVYSTQPIVFGMNLLDFSESDTTDDIITALIPRGSTIQEEKQKDSAGSNASSDDSGPSKKPDLQKRYGIESVNHGVSYLTNDEAVKNFGYIWGVVNFDDLQDPQQIKDQGEKYLKDRQFESLTINLKAADLADLGQHYDHFRLGDRIQCDARPWGVKIVLPVMEMSIDLLDPTQNALTLTKKSKGTFTAQLQDIQKVSQVEISNAQRIQSDKLKSEIANITAIMTGTNGGYKLSQYDKDGRWQCDLYMDTPDPKTAKRVLRINKEGIGGSVNGIAGPYKMGVLINGEILGDRITAGTIDTNRLSADCQANITNSANAYTDKKLTNYVTRSTFTVDIDGIKSTVSQKCGPAEVRSIVKQTADSLVVDANHINLSGYVSANGNFWLDRQGTATITDLRVREGQEIYAENNNTEAYIDWHSGPATSSYRDYDGRISWEGSSFHFKTSSQRDDATIRCGNIYVGGTRLNPSDLSNALSAARNAQSAARNAQSAASRAQSAASRAQSTANSASSSASSANSRISELARGLNSLNRTVTALVRKVNSGGGGGHTQGGDMVELPDTPGTGGWSDFDDA